MLSTRLGNIRKDSLRIHIILLLKKERYFDFRNLDSMHFFTVFLVYPSHSIMFLFFHNLSSSRTCFLAAPWKLSVLVGVHFLK